MNENITHFTICTKTIHEFTKKKDEMWKTKHIHIHTEIFTYMKFENKKLRKYGNEMKVMLIRVGT